MKDEYQKEAIRLLGKKGFVELIAVFNGIKHVMRILCSGKETRDIIALTQELGLYYGQSGYTILEGASYCGFVHTSQVLLHKPTKDSDKRFLYIGVDEISVKLASTFDSIDNRRFGLILGYPECCVDFFCRHYSKDNYDLIFDTDRPVRNHYEALINYACRVFGYSLISHFPCQWDCEASIKLAKSMLKIPESCCIVIAKETMDYLESDVLYSPQVVVAVKNATWNGNLLGLNSENYRIAGNRNVDAIKLDKDIASTLYKDKIVEQLNPFKWLPFQSQHLLTE